MLENPSVVDADRLTMKFTDRLKSSVVLAVAAATVVCNVVSLFSAASSVSRLALILVPHVSVDAPTSGLVRLKFEVKVSAIVGSSYARNCVHVASVSSGVSVHVVDGVGLLPHTMRPEADDALAVVLGNGTRTP
jgi:hypothetical protein